MDRYYEYDDIMLVPKESSFYSRDEVRLDTVIYDLDLWNPIIPAPMESICSPEFIREYDRLGGIAIEPRFRDKETRLNNIKNYRDLRYFGVAVGLSNDGEFDVVQHALDCGADIICIDVANGHNLNTVLTTERISNYIFNNAYNCSVMSGNIASVQGWNSLSDAGADLIRVGIGSGSVCTTRNKTGVGVPQATLIHEINKHCKTYTGGPVLVADGGIRYPGDIVKALALGADLVMCGYLFAKAKECNNNGIYRGMASASAQQDYYGFYRNVEGISLRLKEQLPLRDILMSIEDNVRSGLSYLGASCPEEARDNAEFILVSSTSYKNIPWDTEIIG